MKLSDFVIDFLASRGIRHSFLVTGGAVLHLVDSVLVHPEMNSICVQHEQFGAAAADGYFRASGQMGLAMTTSGPGATNLLTSVASAYFDSIPMICVTGQVATFRLRPNEELRQRGFQETDIVSIFKSVTKYVKLVTDPFMIRYELEKAVYLAQSGRPGPVIIDIPDDLQRVEIEPKKLKSYTPNQTLPTAKRKEIETLFQMISRAKRPVLIYGAGVHCAKVEKEALALARYCNIPTLLTWGAADVMTYDDPLNMGGLGVCGPRAGNFAAHHADLVIAIGTRLSQMITGGKQSLFAPLAQKVMIDIDIEELNKFDNKTFSLDLAIHSDLKAFFKECSYFYSPEPTDRFSDWRTLIASWKKRYPICTDQDRALPQRVNPYVFIQELSKMSQEGDIFITDTGANICWMMQAFQTKANQNIFSAWNHTPMGYALPASVGAALSSKKQIHCLIGDGGLMMCLQELGTVRRYDLPIKIFIFDNEGQSTMKQTIETWLKGRYAAVDYKSGLFFPHYEKLAEAFRLPYICFKNHRDIEENLPQVLSHKGPIICHLEILQSQRIAPMLRFGSALHELEPKLSDDELQKLYEEALQISCEKVSV